MSCTPPMHAGRGADEARGGCERKTRMLSPSPLGRGMMPSENERREKNTAGIDIRVFGDPDYQIRLSFDIMI